MRWCALTAPFHRYLHDAGSLISVALSLGSPPAAVSSYHSLMEPGLSSRLTPRRRMFYSFRTVHYTIVAMHFASRVTLSSRPNIYRLEKIYNKNVQHRLFYGTAHLNTYQIACHNESEIKALG